MDIKELQEIYASHPGVTALQQLADSDYKSCVSVNGLTASSAACAVAGYMHKEEKQTLFIVMNDVEEAGYFYHDLVQICGD
jgi:transcription-repair coupling factor (superfamily II helicase)